MKVCVTGWYYNKPFLEVLSKVKYPVTIVGNRDNPAIKNFNHVLRDNTGLEFGAYDHYIKNCYDGNDSVLFIHDDVECTLDSFKDIAGLDHCNIDQAYINFDEGGHGRAIYCSSRLIKHLLSTKCNSCSYCNPGRDPYNRQHTLPDLTGHNGFFFDPYNTGHTTGNPPPGVRHFNSGIRWFHTKMIELRCTNEWSTVNRLVVPSMVLYKRGEVFENLGNMMGITKERMDRKIKVTAPRVNPDIEHADLVLYTALIGDYDTLKSVHTQSDRVRCVCFTDQDIKDDKGWEIIKIDRVEEDPTRENRRLKLNSHLIFPNTPTIYIDSSMEPKADLLDFISKHRSEFGDVDLLMTKHPTRNCIYEEINRCIETKKDKEALLIKQRIKYEAAGYPYYAGLYECNFIYRKPTPTIRRFNELWWNELKNGSRRDQVSCPIAVMHSGVRIALISKAVRDTVIKLHAHK
jgi:hypothetical protein